MTYVLDTCRGFKAIFDSENLYGKTINIGMNKENSIEGIVKMIAEALSVKISIKSSNKRIRPAKSEVDILVCDNSLLIERTDWTPRITLKEGLSEVIKWIKDSDYEKFYRTDRYNYEIPLLVPSLKGNELKYVEECINDEWVSTAGSYVRKFEEKILISI